MADSPTPCDDSISSGRRFYAQLPVFLEFSNVTDFESFLPVPGDWHVVLSDVYNSTLALQSGNYKHVNTLGAATITAILNVVGSTEIPYVFEGDGAVLCVPSGLLEQARAALLQIKGLARNSFGLELRVATLPVADIRAAGFDIRVARYQASKFYIQAVFTGGGMAYAQRVTKEPATASRYAINEGSILPYASYDGLECRWLDVPNSRGETVSLMVRALDRDSSVASGVYREVIAKVREIYGADELSHPISRQKLRLAFTNKHLRREVAVRCHGSSRWRRWLYLMKLRGLVLTGWYLMTFNRRTPSTDWGAYKDSLIRNSDVKKFNDLYRQILDGSPEQRARLAEWLQDCSARGQLAYGMHVSNRAVITCVVFDYSEHHVHFIDGADGGLFLAAKALKEQMLTLERHRGTEAASLAANSPSLA